MYFGPVLLPYKGEWRSYNLADFFFLDFQIIPLDPLKLIVWLVMVYIVHRQLITSARIPLVGVGRYC